MAEAPAKVDVVDAKAEQVTAATPPPGAGLSSFDQTSIKPGFEEGAGLLSRLTLSWFTKVLSIGVTKQLEIGDLGRPNPKDEGTQKYQQLQDLWDQEVKEKGMADAKLGRVLWRFIGKTNLVYITISAYTSAVLLTAVPVVNKRLLQWLEGTIELSMTERWLLVASMFVLPLMGSFIETHMSMIASRAGVHLYSAFTQMIYRKSVRLSSHARNSATTGRLVNLMSNDAGTTMEQALRVIAPTLTALPQLVVVLILLFAELGLPMFSGFCFILFSVPFAILVFARILRFSLDIGQQTDLRLKSVNDLFTGIRVVKAYAWEKAFMDVIEQVRKTELKFVKKHAYWNMLGMMCVYMQLPQMMQFVTYTTFVAGDGEFSAARLFTAIQLFQLLQQPLTALPSALTQLGQLMSAVIRIGVFLRLHELDNHADDTRTADAAGAGEVAVQLTSDAAFTWDPPDMGGWRVELPQSKAEKRQDKAKKKKERTSKQAEMEKVAPSEQLKGVDGQKEDQQADGKVAPSERLGMHPEGVVTFELKDVGLKVTKGELVALVGPVGSGKSSLLSAVLNEMSRKSGSVVLRGRVGYASQAPWIQNATLRDNVLFGLPYDETWYDKVVKACALTDDLAMLIDGDQTEIGERGINLSGGQKARVNLARAVYSRADVILLDDPLAAVDMHVGDTLFEKCICGLLKDSTVILVTNQVHRLPNVDRVAVMVKGSISEIGTYSELVEAKGAFADLLKRQGVSKDGVGEESLALPRDESVQSGSRLVKPKEEQTGRSPARLTQDEARELGYVSWRVYTWYLRNCGWHLIIALVFGIFLQSYLPVAGTFTLAMWMEDLKANGQDKDRSFGWLSTYGALLACGFCAAVCSGICSAEARVAGARNIHSKLLKVITAAPVAFFDVTPIGRVLNRFSKDMVVIDGMIMMMIYWSFWIGNFVVSAFVAVVISTRGWLLFLAIPSLILYLRIFRFVRISAVEIQRISATTRSPLTSTFQELLIGLSTVRAYNQQDRFQARNTAMVNQNIVPTILSRVAQPAWLALRLNFVGALSSGCCALYAVASHSSDGAQQSAALAGVGLAYSTILSRMMMISIFIMVQVETMMNSVERVKEYVTDVKPEEPNDVPSVLPLVNVGGGKWPTEGRVTMKQLVTGYREGPNILHGISAVIEPCEKIGVVGRTGSGKSTIILSLLRLIEPRSGTVEIDGVDITKLGLEQLRNGVGLIPQDPVLFTGSVRYNIDPFSQFTDEQLWETLAAVNMKDTVARLEKKLEQEVHEGGDNFSVGERQLFCIARALLRNPRILLLDEASASLDNETDAMLQDLIRNLFKEKTVLTIAHRLETIMDSDRVMVLDSGNIAEMDAPLKLLENSDGIFSGLVNAGNVQHLKAIAKLGYLAASKLNLDSSPKASNGNDPSSMGFMMPLLECEI